MEMRGRRLPVVAFLFLLATIFAVLAFGFALVLAEDNGPVPNARPTPTPDGSLPSRAPAAPEGPESPAAPEIPPLPDLIVAKIEVVPSSPIIGQETIIKVTIKNQGTVDVAPGNNFWSDLYVDPAEQPISLGQDGVAEWPCQAVWVPAGGSHTLVATYIFDDVKVFSIYAQVDTDGHVGEANENNNVGGPLQVQVLAANSVVHQSHQEFQLGLASTLDASDPLGVIRRGLFIQDSTDPKVYNPDSQINHPPLPPSHPNNVNQTRPALASNSAGRLYAIWEDGRNGGVYNRDIYFSRGTDDDSDGFYTWLPADDIPVTTALGNQLRPDLAYSPVTGRLYAVWQDGRNEVDGNGDYDIYFAYSDTEGTTWTGLTRLNDDAGNATQLKPSIVVDPSLDTAPDRIYVVWQDQRNLNDDIYLARSDDSGANWGPNYFVTDDPHTTLQSQGAPSISVENLYGVVYVAWEDWRDPQHPEVYAMWSWDRGETFSLDIPVTVVPRELRDTYRREPTIAAHTTIEWVERTDPLTGFVYYVPEPVTVLHAAWQDWKGGSGDIHYSFAAFDWTKPDLCPLPYEFCFEAPQEVSGFAWDSDYVAPPTGTTVWPIEPAWQGDVSLDLVPDDMYWTNCKLASTDPYSKGVWIAWSDARSFDDWRYEIHVRRVASKDGQPKSYEVCERLGDAGMVNSNAKLEKYRDDPALYQDFQPAAVSMRNPDILVDESGIYVAWDDDRRDDPLAMGTVRNRDVFMAKMGYTLDGAYISPVIDGRIANPKWYVLSWWGATGHTGDLLFQIRLGNTALPPKEDVEANGWTPWMGNPSSTYLGCTAGPGCYYDAPGRHILRPDGSDWFSDPNGASYRYMQYKVIMRGSSRLTAVSQVTIHYEGPGRIFLPMILRKH
jgi:hypothetical protein